MTFDELRTTRPNLGLALYAIEPSGGVTLEVYADGELFRFHGATADDAIRSAFPLTLEMTSGQPLRAAAVATPPRGAADVISKASSEVAARVTPTSVFD